MGADFYSGSDDPGQQGIDEDFGLDEPTPFQEEIKQFQDEIAEVEKRLMATRFAEPDFDPEAWLKERGL